MNVRYILCIGVPSTNVSYNQNFSMDVDSETESNHDTALTLACAGGHEELVELLLSRGADIGKYPVFLLSSVF